MFPFLLLALLGCDRSSDATGAEEAPTSALPERDVAYAGGGAWALDGHRVELRDGMLYADGAAVLRGVYDAPVAGAHTLWVPADPGEGDGGIYAVAVHDGIVLAEPLLTEGRPDRLALSPDGETIAFVAGLSGLASVWVLPAKGGSPRQLTNVGVERPLQPGVRPAGFEPSPTVGSLRFDGDRVRWTDPEGTPREKAWR